MTSCNAVSPAHQPSTTWCWLFLVTVSLATLGCNSRTRTAGPVNESVAREALSTVLEAWKAGVAAQELQSRSPKIVVQDMSWQGGTKLKQYEILDGAKRIDANLHCPVRLHVRTPDGKELQQEVVYIVGTDPVITVFRQLF